MATPCADTREFSRARGGGIGGQASMEAERGGERRGGFRFFGPSGGEAAMASLLSSLFPNFSLILSSRNT